MKKYFLLLLLATSSVIVNAQDKNAKAYLTKSFSGETIDKIVSETSGGNIIVMAVSPADSHVEVFVNQIIEKVRW